MAVRNIQAQLQEIYAVDLSPRLISEATAALMVKMRHEGHVENRAVFLATGADEEGQRDWPGRWSAANEGAKFWLSVTTELKNRGFGDV